MQNKLDKKNRTALDQWGSKTILGALANVSPKPPKSEQQAKDFVDRYGALYPSATPEFDVIYYGERFRWAWAAKNDERAAEAVNSFLDDIFAADFLSNDPRPAIAANFIEGKWEPVPRNLLDVLARELMRSRKMLHRCERPDCQRYMVKEFSRDRYCSLVCSEKMRELGQRQWALEHRKELNHRRRKPKGKGRQ